MFPVIVNILIFGFVCTCLCLCSSVCGQGRDVPLLSPASRVINGSRTYQTNMDPMVAMGTASAAPQKGGRGRERGKRMRRRRRRSGMWSEKQEGEGEEQGGWLMEKEEIEKEGWRERGEERSPLLSVWNIWFSRKGDLGEEDKGSLALSLCFSYHFSLPPLSLSLILLLCYYYKWC